MCRETFRVYTILPSSALRAEMGKHVYPYFGLNLSATSTPPYPAWLYLNAGNAHVSLPHRITASEFETTVTYSFTAGNDGAAWAWNWCVNDTVSRDGLGLPGSHHCGAHRIRATLSYLG